MEIIKCSLGTNSVRIWSGGYYKYVAHRTDELKSPAPFNLTIMVGSKNVAITRKFADFVINANVSKVMKRTI